MRKFNLVKSLTRVINNIPALRGKVRMGLLCLSLATFGVESAWGQYYVLQNQGTSSVELMNGWSSPTDKSYTLTGPGALLTFEVEKVNDGMFGATGNITVQAGSTTIRTIKMSDLSKKNVWYQYSVDLTEYDNYKTNRSITFSANGTLAKYLRSAQVTMAQYLEDPSTTSLDFGSGIVGSASTSNTVTVAWCNVPGMTYAITGPNANLFTVSLDVNAEYGKYNTSTFTVTYEHSTAGKHSATLTISDSYNNYSKTVTLSGTTTRKTAEITWNEGTNLMNVDEYLENPASSTNSTLDVKYTSSNSSVIEVLEGGVLHALKYSATPVTVTAYQEESGDWARVEKQQTITVTNKQKQSIDWTEKLSFEYSGTPYTYQLSASASSSITYSIATDGGSIASVSGNTLTIKGIGKTTITATAAETDDYVGVSATRRLTVRDPNAACDDPFYEEPNEHSFTAADGKSWETPTFIYEPHTVSFQAYKTMATAVGSLYVYEYVNNSWKEIKEIGVGSLDKNSYKDFGPYELSRGATKVKIGTKAGSYTRYIRNIEVTLSKYLESATTELNFTAEAGAKAPQQTFYINYSNIQGPIFISCTDKNGIFSFPDEIDAECGDVAKNVPVTVDMLAQSSGSVSETLTLTDKKGQTTSVTLKATVSKLKQSIEWDDETNYKTTDSPVLTAKSSTLREDMLVTYRSGDETIAQVNGSKVTFLKAGDVTIYANQAGNTYYEAAPEVSKVFHVSKVTPTIVTMPTVGNAITYGSKLSDVDLTGGSAKDDKGNAVTGHFVWANPDEIPHGGQQQYTVRFVPDNTDMYATDAVSTETLTITVNKADQTLTWNVADPIKIKKEDGDYTLTASSTSGRTITYTLSKTELATISSNILTPLKSGNCTITAVCPADGDYNVSNAIEKNLFIAGPDEIVWKYKNGDHVWAGQNLNAKGDLATAHTTVYFGKDETQWYLTVNNSTNPKTVYSESASDGALVEINGRTEGNEYYSQVSSAIHVYIDRCYQGLVWDQNFLTYLADEQGHIDETDALTAYAVDSLNRKTDLPIVYSVDNPAVAEVVGDATNGWKLHIIGAGSATLTASVAQTNIYQGVTETRKINVRKAGEPCGSYALISTSEKKISDIGDNTYTFDKPGETLTFKTRKNSIFILDADVTVQGWNYRTNTWEHIDTYNLNNTDKSTKIYTINEDFRAIKMFTGADIENNKRYISDLYITQKEYIRSSVDKIDEKIYINQDFSKTFTVDYSDKPYISCTIDNDQLEILRDDDNNTCGEYGTITFTVKNKNTWLTPTTIKGNITLSTSVGDNIITIPVTIQVELGGTYKFTNKLGDGDWGNPKNWDYGGTEATSLPERMNQVQILQPVRITKEVSVYELDVETDPTEGSNGYVTIAPTGGLTIYNGGVKRISDKLTIESSREHTGYFRVVPNVVEGWAATPTATMQYASKGSLDSGANRDATWQYFGIPVKGADFTVDYVTWLYEWSEPNGWIDLKSAAQPVHLKPFQGYAITQYGQPIYDFTGSLNMGKVDLNLTYTEGDGMWGDNMFANSYPSPIDVKLFTEEDFVNLDHKTIYLYNSGSWNQWNDGTQGGDWEHLINDGAPGTFTAIPALAAPYLETEQTLIAPMQGMCIHTDQKSGATVHLDYAKHVWDAMPTGSKDDMNAPLLVPSRKKSSQKPEGVSDEAWENIQYAQARHDSIEEAHKQKVAELRHRVRLTVYGENSGVDHIYLLEKDGFTADYDNGYDAYKMFSDGLLNIYTSEDFGEMAVSASDKIEGTFIGFNAGEGEAYQLKVSSVIGDNLYLKDLLNGAEIPLQEGQMYMFNAVPKLKEAQRFVIVERENQGVGTSLDGVMGGEAYIWTDNENVHIEHAAANTLVRLFSSEGKLITTTTVSGSGEINISTLPNNVYMVMLNEQTYKFVKK